MQNNKKKSVNLKIPLLTVWLILYFKINFGAIRSPLLLGLLENNQTLLKILFILVIGIVCKKELLDSFKRINLSVIKYALLMGSFTVVINFLLIFSIFGKFSVGPVEYNIFFLFQGLLIAPFYEELIYRFIFLGLSPNVKIKTTMAILSTALFFYNHRFNFSGNILTTLQIVVLAAALIFVYLKTDNIFSAITAHFFYNFLIIFISMAGLA